MTNTVVTAATSPLARPGPKRLLDKMAKAKHRVLVLGGGFGGVYAAKYLSDHYRHRDDVHVELLSAENYFVFQPLLPEVAAGGVQATHVVNPIRDIVPHAQFRWCKVERIDPAQNLVYAAQGEAKELVGVPYDHVVFALGKVSDFRVIPGATEHALAMKDLADAFYLRNHVFRCLELADVEDEPEEKQALLTFVIGGAGFSGVETAGELSEMLSKVLHHFHNIDANEIKLVLVHSRDQLLPEMPKSLGDSAKKVFAKRGMDMRLGVRVKACTPKSVYLSNGDVIPTRTFVCTVGNAPNPACKELLGGPFQEAKVDGKGVGIFLTNREMQCLNDDGAVVPGHWAVGDCAGVPSPTGAGLCAATAQFAMRQGRTAADNIIATIEGKPLRTFNFKGLGSLASLGSRKAVADMMGLKLTGFIAWFAWRTVYLSKLPGMVRRLRVTLDWTLDLFFPRDITQLQALRTERFRVEHFEAGEVILSALEIGRSLYVIKRGEVEVFMPSSPAQILASLKQGDCFGEKALLTDAPRSACVRAKTAVDVMVVSRADFSSMIEQFPVLDQYFDELMHTRYPELLGDKSVKDAVMKDLAQPR
jgi:NADH:ubiquinone reductase (H+-translocating)